MCSDEISLLCEEDMSELSSNKASHLVYKYNYTDCKEFFMSGNTISGVYTINPDEGTPFEVSVSIIT